MKINDFGRFGLSREASWSSFVVSWGPLGPSIGRLGPFLGHVGAIWAVLGGSSRPPETSSGHLGASWGRPMVRLGRPLNNVEAFVGRSYINNNGEGSCIRVYRVFLMYDIRNCGLSPLTAEIIQEEQAWRREEDRRRRASQARRASARVATAGTAEQVAEEQMVEQCLGFVHSLQVHVCLLVFMVTCEHVCLRLHICS